MKYYQIQKVKFNMSLLLFFIFHSYLLFGCNQVADSKSKDDKSPILRNEEQVINDTTIQNDPKNQIVDIVAVGDIMLGTNFPDNSTLPVNADALMNDADSLLKNAHITFGNLEGVFLNEGGQSKGSGPNVYNFRQPENYAVILKNKGFDFLSIANNHSYDFGAIGLENTTRVLKEQNLNFAGTKSFPFTMVERDGIKIGMVAFAPHNGCLDLNDLKSVTELVINSKKKCDILLVSFHAGAEGGKALHVTRKHEIFYLQDRGNIYEAAHAVIDAGADVVIGHGPHVPRAIELYKNRLIAYSLGNFCTYAKFNLKGISGYAPLLSLKTNNKGEFLDGQIFSFLQLGEGGPKIDVSNAAAGLIKELSITDFPESELKIDEKGRISKTNVKY
jgi:hypothetical protein